MSASGWIVWGIVWETYDDESLDSEVCIVLGQQPTSEQMLDLFKQVITPRCKDAAELGERVQDVAEGQCKLVATPVEVFRLNPDQ